MTLSPSMSDAGGGGDGVLPLAPSGVPGEGGGGVGPLAPGGVPGLWPRRWRTNRPSFLVGAPVPPDDRGLLQSLATWLVPWQLKQRVGRRQVATRCAAERQLRQRSSTSLGRTRSLLGPRRRCDAFFPLYVAPFARAARAGRCGNTCCQPSWSGAVARRRGPRRWWTGIRPGPGSLPAAVPVGALAFVGLLRRLRRLRRLDLGSLFPGGADVPSASAAVRLRGCAAAEPGVEEGAEDPDLWWGALFGGSLETCVSGSLSAARRAAAR